MANKFTVSDVHIDEWDEENLSIIGNCQIDTGTVTIEKEVFGFVLPLCHKGKSAFSFPRTFNSNEAKLIKSAIRKAVYMEISDKVCNDYRLGWES